MAIALNASGERLIRTTSLPTATSYTACGWYMRRGTGQSDNWNCVWSLLESDTFYHILYTRDGTATNRFSGYFGGFQTGYILTGFSDDVWHFVAITCSGTGAGQGIVYAAATGSSTLSTTNVAGSSVSPVNFGINGNSVWDEWGNSRYSNWMIYDTALTQNQLTRQFLSGQYRPLIWENLHAWYPMLPGEDRLKDYSGNAKTLTLNSGTITEELANPLAWGWHASYQPYAPAAAVVSTLPHHILRPKQQPIPIHQLQL